MPKISVLYVLQYRIEGLNFGFDEVPDFGFDEVPSIMYCKTYKTEIFGADRNFPDSRCRVPASRYLPSTVKRIKPKFSAIMIEIFGKTEIFGKKR